MSINVSGSLERQGREGEIIFREWLKKHNSPFLEVGNDKDSYCQLFKGKLKRPDFLLLIEGMGLLAVDVKNYSRARKSGGFFLNFEEELVYSVEFEHAFNLYLWYAIRDKDSNDLESWYFISAYDALEQGKKEPRSDGTHYFDIAEEHFICLKDATNIPDLLRKRRGITGYLTRLVEKAFLSTKV